MPILKDIAAVAKGMSITFREMFKPTIVENYPDGPGPLKGAKFQERFRGVHVLQRDESGLEKCVACFLCAAACPSKDRKSTRLNSSHSQISYAVFCLKKKKNTHCYIDKF